MTTDEAFLRSLNQLAASSLRRDLGFDRISGVNVHITRIDREIEMGPPIPPGSIGAFVQSPMPIYAVVFHMANPPWIVGERRPEYDYDSTADEIVELPESRRELPRRV